ncbi:MAG: carbohydrate kinase [Dictyoglomus thermophilum]|nr:carbohydrate kinase [Dictyoglomus thermophilum]MCX7721362.1 carbohydrate kinase [Dictyoglomus thermophilum]
MIIVGGEALIDFTPIEINGEIAYIPKEGGSPYNVAITLGRLGAPCGFFGKISYDFFGEMLIEKLKKNHVDISLVLRSEKNTTLAFVILREGEPHFIFYGENTADVSLEEKDIPLIDPEKVELIHFGSISMIREPGCFVLEKMMTQNHGKVLISFDPNIRPNLIRDKNDYLRKFEAWLKTIDILKASIADIKWLYETESMDEIARYFLEKDVKIFLLTLGKEGSIGYTKFFSAFSKGKEVKVVDTVGAGDAFMGGFLYYLNSIGKLNKNFLENVTKTELENALDFSNTVSALTCTKKGAEPPYLAEVENFMGKRYY